MDERIKKLKDEFKKEKNHHLEEFIKDMGISYDNALVAELVKELFEAGFNAGADYVCRKVQGFIQQPTVRSSEHQSVDINININYDPSKAN